jgi:hypothetical protein
MPISTGSNQVLTNLGTAPITPDFQMQALRTVAGQGASIAGAPYQGYAGPRIAELTSDQLNAQQMQRDIAAGVTPNREALASAVQYGLSGFDPEQIKKYMSPYTTGVVDEMRRLSNRNLMQSTLPGVNTTFAGAGQFGSTRNADFTNQAIQNENYNLLGQQAKALESGYNSALDEYRTWHQNALGNAAAGASLGSTASNNLNAVGTQNQNQTQRSYDLAYGDFKNQRDYPMQQLGWYSDLVSGQKMPNASASLSYDNTMAQSPLMQGLGTAASIYGTFK